MKKAKSRLIAKEQARRSLSPPDPGQLIRGYLTHLPILLISLVLYGVLGWIIFNIPPSRIANLLLVDSYLPFAAVLFLGNVLFLSYIFLNTRRGLVVAAILQVLVFLKLQKVEIELSWLLLMLLLFLMIEYILTKVRKK